VELDKKDIRAIAGSRYIRKNIKKFYIITASLILVLPLVALLPMPYSAIIATSYLMLVTIAWIDFIIQQGIYERGFIAGWEAESRRKEGK